MAGERRPKAAVPIPAHRQVRTGGIDPNESDKSCPAWQFHRWDLEHQHWGWRKLDLKEWISVLGQLQQFETMTWGAIKSAAGGKGEGKGTNSHHINLSKFCKDAQERWAKLRLEQFDEVFSLRLQGKLRIYGIKEGRALKVVWHDPHHGDARGAYQLAKT